jgi:hypothetical protein
MDADGEDRPEDLLRLIAPLREEPEKRRTLCVARRTTRRESFQFKSMYFFFRLLFRALTGVTVRSGNYAAYRGWLARRMLRHPYFDLCYSSSLVSLDIPVTSVPCPRGERYAGRSRMNLFSLSMHGLRMLMPFTDRIAVRALAAFSVIFGGRYLRLPGGRHRQALHHGGHTRMGHCNASVYPDPVVPRSGKLRGPFRALLPLAGDLAGRIGGTA